MGVVGAIGLVLQGASYIRQRQEARKAEEAQKESREIQGASQRIQDRAARRRAARETRIRKAVIMNSAAQSGGQGSSGEAGSVSALTSNFSSAVANQRSQQRAAEGISKQNQIAATAQSNIEAARGFSQLVGSGMNLYYQYATPTP